MPLKYSSARLNFNIINSYILILRGRRKFFNKYFIQNLVNKKKTLRRSAIPLDSFGLIEVVGIAKMDGI